MDMGAVQRLGDAAGLLGAYMGAGIRLLSGLHNGRVRVAAFVMAMDALGGDLIAVLPVGVGEALGIARHRHIPRRQAHRQQQRQTSAPENRFSVVFHRDLSFRESEVALVSIVPDEQTFVNPPKV